MPKIQVNGVELYYEDTGGIGKEVIVFSHGLLLNCRMFDSQVAAFSNRFRCISYDHRGQGDRCPYKRIRELYQIAHDA